METRRRPRKRSLSSTTTTRRPALGFLVLLFWLGLDHSFGVVGIVQGWRPRFLRRNRNSKEQHHHHATSVTAISPPAEMTCPVDPFATIQSASTNTRNGDGDDDMCQKHHYIHWLYHQLPESLQVYLTQVAAVFMHKPPVGIVAIFVTVRLLWTGRIFAIYQHKQKSAESVLSQVEERKASRRKRSKVTLDKADLAYIRYGGVQRIRRKLCWSALHDGLSLSTTTATTTTTTTANESEDETLSTLAVAAVNALRVSYKPRSSLYTFVEDMVEPLSTLETILVMNDDDGADDTTQRQTLDWQVRQDLDFILQMSSKTCEIRALDALLRLSRDHLLATSSRLRRNLKHWNRRVRLNTKMGWIMGRFISIEGDRTRLSFAKAAFDAEVTRLGDLQKILAQLPDDMSDQALLDSLSQGKKKSSNGPTTTGGGRSESSVFPTTNKTNMKRRWKFPGSTHLPNVSKYSLRYNAEGRGRITLRVYDGETVLHGDASRELLLKPDRGYNPKSWMEQAKDWTQVARLTLCNVLRETVKTSVTKDEDDIRDLQTIEKWCSYDFCGDANILAEQWLAILDLADGLETQRRVGEGREISIIGDSGLRLWTRRLDVFGIPSALATVGVAKIAHNVLVPYWPRFKKYAYDALLISWSVFVNRFWEPFLGIAEGLVQKDSGVLEAFDVENEEKSLDNMLEDLNLGDGSESTRKEALQGAARLYEDELAHGVIRSAIRGRLVRLLLIQVQQLKAGLLHALSSIDVLVAANRLNIQIMAAIPAVLIVYLGSKVLFRSIFTIRVKDLRSIRDVHAEMADYLDDMEVALLLVAPVINDEAINGYAQDGRPYWTSTAVYLSPMDLGEFVLRVYSYLVLLDYSSAVFPSRATTSIQAAMNDLMASHRLGVDRQVALLRVIKQKHMDLLKYL